MVRSSVFTNVFLSFIGTPEQRQHLLGGVNDFLPLRSKSAPLQRNYLYRHQDRRSASHTTSSLSSMSDEWAEYQTQAFQKIPIDIQNQYQLGPGETNNLGIMGYYEADHQKDVIRTLVSFLQSDAPESFTIRDLFVICGVEIAVPLAISIGL